jgi:hypothetical protein
MSKRISSLNKQEESGHIEQNQKVRQEQEQLERLTNRELRRHIHVNPACNIHVSHEQVFSPLLLTNIQNLQITTGQEIQLREVPEGPLNSPSYIIPPNSP